MLRFSLLIFALLGSACAHNKIPMTNIEDTEENREILDVVKSYHRAMESLDSDAVLAMISPRYYEDNGNLDSGDDYDYDQLKLQLKGDFQRTRALRLEIRVDAISVDENSAWAELYFQLKAHNEFPSGLKWQTSSDRTRFKFERVDKKWLIVSGL